MSVPHVCQSHSRHRAAEALSDHSPTHAPLLFYLTSSRTTVQHGTAHRLTSPREPDMPINTVRDPLRRRGRSWVMNIDVYYVDSQPRGYFHAVPLYTLSPRPPSSVPYHPPVQTWCGASAAAAAIAVYAKMHGLAIRRNTIQCMQAILEAILSLEIELEPEAAAAADRIMEVDEGAELSPDVVQVGRVCVR